MSFFARRSSDSVLSHLKISQRIDKKRLHGNKGAVLFCTQNIIGPTFGAFTLKPNLIVFEALNKILTA